LNPLATPSNVPLYTPRKAEKGRSDPVATRVRGREKKGGKLRV